MREESRAYWQAKVIGKASIIPSGVLHPDGKFNHKIEKHGGSSPLYMLWTRWRMAEFSVTNKLEDVADLSLLSPLFANK